MRLDERERMEFAHRTRRRKKHGGRIFHLFHRPRTAREASLGTCKATRVESHCKDPGWKYMGTVIGALYSGVGKRGATRGQFARGRGGGRHAGLDVGRLPFAQ